MRGANVNDQRLTSLCQPWKQDLGHEDLRRHVDLDQGEALFKTHTREFTQLWPTNVVDQDADFPIDLIQLRFKLLRSKDRIKAGEVENNRLDLDAVLACDKLSYCVKLGSIPAEKYDFEPRLSQLDRVLFPKAI